MFLNIVNNFFFTELCGAVLILIEILRSLFFKNAFKSSRYFLAFSSLILGIYSWQYIDHIQVIFGGLYIHDNLTIFFKCLLYIIFAIVILFFDTPILKRKNNLAEYYLCAFLCILSAIFTIAANDLIAFYISLEILTICIFILLFLQKDNFESSLQFFILNAISSAILIYGISLIYNFFHSTNLYNISSIALENSSHEAYLGIACIMTSFMFKMTIFPLHIWAPNIYQKSSLINFFFLAIISKVTIALGFLKLVNVFSEYIIFLNILQIVGVISAIFGSIMMVKQDNIQRFLAFSGIVNFSYLLILLGINKISCTIYIFFIIAYILNNLGILFLLNSVNGNLKSFDQMRGLIFKLPLFSIFLVIFFISLAGFPPTLGFFSKFLLIKGLLISHHCIYLILAIITSSVVALYAYFKPVVHMLQVLDSKKNNLFIDNKLSIFITCAIIVLQVVCILYLGDLLDNLIMNSVFNVH